MAYNGFDWKLLFAENFITKKKRTKLFLRICWKITNQNEKGIKIFIYTVPLILEEKFEKISTLLL